MLFREGDGEVLDAGFDPKSFEEGDEVSEVFDVVVVSFVGFDVSQEDYVVGEIVRAVSTVQNDDCC